MENQSYNLFIPQRSGEAGLAIWRLNKNAYKKVLNLLERFRRLVFHIEIRRSSSSQRCGINHRNHTLTHAKHVANLPTRHSESERRGGA